MGRSAGRPIRTSFRRGEWVYHRIMEFVPLNLSPCHGPLCKMKKVKKAVA